MEQVKVRIFIKKFKKPHQKTVNKKDNYALPKLKTKNSEEKKSSQDSYKMKVKI